MRVLQLAILLSLFSCFEGNPERKVQSLAQQNTSLEPENVLIFSSAYRKEGKQNTDKLIALALNERKLEDIGFVDMVESIHTEGNDLCTNSSISICEDANEFVNCGATPGSALSSFISDCSQKNSKAIWQGGLRGFAGETNWVLVSRATDSSNHAKEVWKDVSTGLLWSDKLIDSNWCKSTGNTEDNGNSGDCSQNSVNLCGEVSNEDENNAARGYINSTTSTDKVVHWRVPTRNELLQADINGLRFVHRAFRLANRSSSSSNFNVWSASTVSYDKTKAWLYDGVEGILSTDDKEDNAHVICVGWPLKQ